MSHLTLTDRSTDCTIAQHLLEQQRFERVVSARKTRSWAFPRLMRTVTSLVLLFGVADMTTAEEVLPSDGKIMVNFTWTARDLSTVPSSEGREAFVNETFVVLTATAPAPFQRLGGRCIGAGNTDTATFAFEMSGSCEYRDADGDTIFERFEEHSTGDGSPAEGKGTLLGGTGKFVGLTGDYAYRSEFYASVTSGVYQGEGTKEGQWHLASTQ